MEMWITDVLDSKYCTFLVSLFATILSFVDPMTDIFTLVEFYRDNHKTWFAVGLAFVVGPCVSFFVFMRRFDSSRKETLLCGFNPFSPAWLRLKICWRNFEKCCWDDNSNEDNNDNNDDLDEHSALVQIFEAVLESAPQFIIQLYAMSVQQEPVKIIQMISLSVSFLSLAWAFTVYDSSLFGIFKGWNVVLFVNYLFLLSSRLFAVTFFTITYKWWIISVLMIHSVLILIADAIWSHEIESVFQNYCSSWKVVSLPALRSCLNWLRDDMSPTSSVMERACFSQRMIRLSNILFVIENITMILTFYRFSPFSNTWYSLPVSVCACLFSVIGVVVRVCFVTKKSRKKNRKITQPKLEIDQTDESGVSRFDMMVEYVSYV